MLKNLTIKIFTTLMMQALMCLAGLPTANIDKQSNYVDFSHQTPYIVIIKQFHNTKKLGRSGVLQIWLERYNHAVLHKQYDICFFSGTLGPKEREGDNQAPEGIYKLTPDDVISWSQYDRALKLNYPNRYDKKLGRTGSNIMIHGDCTSVGCFAMDKHIKPIYAFVKKAFEHGIEEIPVFIYPTEQNASKNYQQRLKRLNRRD